MKKLNFGCGNRYSNKWDNLDFYPHSKSVKSCNFLRGFPFDDNVYDVVYSSHVLEHFTIEQARNILLEAKRVMKPGGILRIVVPDFEETVKEYLRIIKLPNDNPQKSKQYDWILVEMIDQFVRRYPSGKMGDYLKKLKDSSDLDFKNYVYSRVQSRGNTKNNCDITTKLKKIASFSNIKAKLLHYYIQAVFRLVPRGIGSMIFIRCHIGELHQWVYDRYGLEKLCLEIGFENLMFLSYDTSNIPDFNQDILDRNADGTSYKNNSIYMECNCPS